LEQLLIEIPQDNNVESRRSGMPTRNTRSQVKGLVLIVAFSYSYEKLKDFVEKISTYTALLS